MEGVSFACNIWCNKAHLWPHPTSPTSKSACVLSSLVLSFNNLSHFSWILFNKILNVLCFCVTCRLCRLFRCSYNLNSCFQMKPQLFPAPDFHSHTCLCRDTSFLPLTSTKSRRSHQTSHTLYGHQRCLMLLGLTALCQSLLLVLICACYLSVSVTTITSVLWCLHLNVMKSN